MILSTVPGTVALGCSRIRRVFRFSSAILADFAVRGFAISFLTLACVALPRAFLAFLILVLTSITVSVVSGRLEEKLFSGWMAVNEIFTRVRNQ